MAVGVVSELQLLLKFKYLQFVAKNGSLNIFDVSITAPPTLPTMPPPDENNDGSAGDNFDRSHWSSCSESSGKLLYILLYSRLSPFLLQH